MVFIDTLLALSWLNLSVLVVLQGLMQVLGHSYTACLADECVAINFLVLFTRMIALHVRVFILLFINQSLDY